MDLAKPGRSDVSSKLVLRRTWLELSIQVNMFEKLTGRLMKWKLVNWLKLGVDTTKMSFLGLEFLRTLISVIKPAPLVSGSSGLQASLHIFSWKNKLTDQGQWVKGSKLVSSKDFSL